MDLQKREKNVLGQMVYKDFTKGKQMHWSSALRPVPRDLYD